jgi:phage shock protein A
MTMNKLLRRLKGGLDALLAPAEDPRLAFASAEQRQQDLLALARRALAELSATRRQLHARKLAIQEHLPQLEQQAQRALAAGREDLARVALRRRHIAAAELRLLEQQAQELLAKEQQLALHEERLAAQAEAFQARLKLISASYSAAEVQVRMNEALSGVSEEMTHLSQALEQAEQQTEHLQAHAAALEALVRDGAADRAAQPPRDGADLRDALLAEDALVEAEIAALKQRLREANASD